MFLSISPNHLLNMGTLKFEYYTAEQKDVTILIPFYAWQHGDDTHIIKRPNGTTIRKVNTIELNGTTISFEDNKFVTIYVRFVDNKHGGAVQTLKLLTVVKNADIWANWQVDSIEFSLYQGDNMFEAYTSNLRQSSMTNFDAYKGLPGLASTSNLGRFFCSSEMWRNPKTAQSAISAVMGHLLYGMVNRQLNLYYRGKKIGVKFVWFIGKVAILLNEDLTFNSIVVVGGTYHPTEMIIEKFLYTTDVKFIKVQTMLE